MKLLNFTFLSSGTPLLYRTIPAWFVRVHPEKLVENNKDTLWYITSLYHCQVYKD
jgi:isoleucyl-tRNA synthetase